MRPKEERLLLAADWDTHAHERTALCCFSSSTAYRETESDGRTLGSIRSGCTTPVGVRAAAAPRPHPRSEGVLLDGVMHARGDDAEAEERRVEPVKDGRHREEQGDVLHQGKLERLDEAAREQSTGTGSGW
jgi:hypothetical protein